MTTNMGGTMQDKQNWKSEKWVHSDQGWTFLIEHKATNEWQGKWEWRAEHEGLCVTLGGHAVTQWHACGYMWKAVIAVDAAFMPEEEIVARYTRLNTQQIEYKNQDVVFERNNGNDARLKLIEIDFGYDPETFRRSDLPWVVALPEIKWPPVDSMYMTHSDEDHTMRFGDQVVFGRE